MRNAYKNLDRNPEGQRPHEDLSVDVRVILNVCGRNRMGGCGLVASDLE
jgi:hypothetical protein